MFRIFIAALLSIAISMAQLNPTPTGSIRGAVTDDKGKSMSGVIVTALLSVRPPFSRTATSAGDGSFQILGLPAGKYMLCMQLPGGGYVDACQWSSSPPMLTLANRQASIGNLVKLAKGSIVKVRMQDPNRQMAQKTKDGRQPHLLVGVPTPRGGFLPAHVAHKDNAGADFELTVPLDMRLTMQVISKDLKLGDDHGLPLANNAARDSFQHGNGDPNPKSFSYTVLGQLP